MLVGIIIAVGEDIGVISIRCDESISNEEDHVAIRYALELICRAHNLLRLQVAACIDYGELSHIDTYCISMLLYRILYISL